ncbi:FliM/FliN family flagellar motor switch protein [Romboutsia sp.]|uniref:FliM/FliN family flagellar motor switch protein n=1 Tax=Romboutsia sp. TaxID=1965302 RepID=UPI003F3C5679
MKEIKTTDKIYDIEFEQLVEGEKVPVNTSEEIMNAKVEVTVSMGATRQKIDKIINLKVGDVISLNKHVEEELDINVNGQPLASGESLIIENKLAVRLSKVKHVEEDIL